MSEEYKEIQRSGQITMFTHLEEKVFRNKFSYTSRKSNWYEATHDRLNPFGKEEEKLESLNLWLQGLVKESFNIDSTILEKILNEEPYNDFFLVDSNKGFIIRCTNRFMCLLLTAGKFSDSDYEYVKDFFHYKFEIDIREGRWGFYYNLSSYIQPNTISEISSFINQKKIPQKFSDEILEVWEAKTKWHLIYANPKTAIYEKIHKLSYSQELSSNIYLSLEDLTIDLSENIKNKEDLMNFEIYLKSIKQNLNHKHTFPKYVQEMIYHLIRFLKFENPTHPKEVQLLNRNGNVFEFLACDEISQERIVLLSVNSRFDDYNQMNFSHSINYLAPEVVPTENVRYFLADLKENTIAITTKQLITHYNREFTPEGVSYIKNLIEKAKITEDITNFPLEACLRVFYSSFEVVLNGINEYSLLDSVTSQIKGAWKWDDKEKIFNQYFSQKMEVDL